MSEARRNANKRMVDWAREAVAKEEERFGYIRAPVLARLGQQELAKDPEFLQMFWGDSGYQTMYAAINGVIRVSRHTGPVLTEREVDPDDPDAVPETAPISKSVFGRWKEHAGDKYVPLLHMGKVELLTAAEERREYNIPNVARERFIRWISEQLNEDELVGDRFSAEQLEKQYRQIEAKTRKGWK